MAAVLITVDGDTVDYVTDGDCTVVLVDFNDLDPDFCFPEDIDTIIEDILELPQTIGWRAGVIKRLTEIKAESRRVIQGGS